MTTELPSCSAAPLQAARACRFLSFPVTREVCVIARSHNPKLRGGDTPNEEQVNAFRKGRTGPGPDRIHAADGLYRTRFGGRFCERRKKHQHDLGLGEHPAVDGGSI